MVTIIRTLILMFILALSFLDLQAQIPDKFYNLRVLPLDISKRELIGKMKGAAQGLGVRCEFCHVGEAGKDLSTFDFVSDEKEHKKIARVMFKMVNSVNNEFMPQVAKFTEHQPEIKCMTCHAGNKEPAGH